MLVFCAYLPLHMVFPAKLSRPDGGAHTLTKQPGEKVSEVAKRYIKDNDIPENISDHVFKQLIELLDTRCDQD
jgi:hypothetical protein